VTPAQEVTREAVAATVRDVLARREFAGSDSMLADFLEWLLGRLGSGDSAWSRAASIGELLFAIVLGLLAAALLYALVRFVAAGRLRGARARDERGFGGTPVHERVRALRREAAAARARGELRLALRKLVFALVLGLGERGDLRYRDSWTVRELLRRGRPSEEARGVLVPLVSELEAKEFGRVEATGQDLDRLEALCERHLGALEGAAA